ncbi:MAG: arginine decarboxylase [Cytophagales bacterium]
MDKYKDLIEQTFFFPTDEFTLDEKNELVFNGVPLMPIIEKYGTPLKLSYLPKIPKQINRAKEIFNKAIQKYGYSGKYTYCYCTKSSHFEFVLNEVLKSGAQIETSSTYDIHIVKDLYKKGKINKDTFILSNGYKKEEYKEQITSLINDGFTNAIPILDHLEEFDYYEKHAKNHAFLGIRIAADEEPKFNFYTSRLGVRYNDIIDLYKSRIAQNPNFTLKLLHFFINSGIKDTMYYWSELSRFVELYCQLKKVCPTLDSLDIGGGFPIKTSVHFDYNYEYMADQIVYNIKKICDQHGVEVPNIYSEFGSYTVGESGAAIYSVLGKKLQNDKELWYMIDSSFITTLPDVWGLNQKYLMLAVNNWNRPGARTNIGGITCDSMDYYNSEAHTFNVYLPNFNENEEKQYIGFFHTGAYQESLGGYGGIQHCLIPAPKHILIEKDENGEISTRLFRAEQSPESMMKLLGYQEN